MRCVGAPADIAVQPELLKHFQANSTGVNYGARCTPSPTQWEWSVTDNTDKYSNSTCLITICSGMIVLNNSGVSHMQGGSLDAAICVVGTSTLEAHNSEFSWNNSTALACFDKAQLLLHGSRVAHNGYISSDAAERFYNLTGVDSSKMLPTAPYAGLRLCYGGGVAAYNAAKVTIDGQSAIHNNSVLAVGGLYALHSSEVLISGQSSLHHNTAVLGGGLAAFGRARVTITGNSSLHDNVAERFGVLPTANGGGVAAYLNSHVSVTAGSRICNNKELYGNGGGGGAHTAVCHLLHGGDSSVHSNYARVGGGLAAVGAVVRILNSTVSHNTARWGGGVIFSKCPNVIAQDSVVRGNKAVNGSGGGVNVVSCDNFAMTSSNIIHNKCEGCMGGGIFVGLGTSATEGNLFDVAGNGHLIQVRRTPALSSSSKSRMVISNSTIGNNTSTLPEGEGGGLVIASQAMVSLEDHTRLVANKERDSSGGGVA